MFFFFFFLIHHLIKLIYSIDLCDIRNLENTHLTFVFQLQNIHLEFSTCPLKFKWILSTDKLVLNGIFQDFKNINNELICFKKTKNIPHAQYEFLALNTYL